MKKLTLKKDVVARINHDEMIQLKGGNGNSYFLCEHTHPKVATCNDNGVTCIGATCEDTCHMESSCPGRYSCDESCVGTCKSCASCVEVRPCVTTASISCGGPGNACY